MPLRKITAEIDGKVQTITAEVPEGTTDEELIEYVRQSYNQPTVQPRREAGLIDKTLDFMRGLENVPAYAAGTAAAKAVPTQFKLPVGAAAAGATYIGLDRLLQGVMDTPATTYFGFDDPNWKAVENLAIGELSGQAATKVTAGLRRAWQEFIKPGSKVDPILFKLRGTYSQYTGQKLPKVIEDLFTSKTKQVAQERSAELGRKELLKEAARESGISETLISEKPHALARGGTATAATVERRMREVTDLQANIAKDAALDEPVTVVTKIKPTSLTDPKNKLIELSPATPPVLDSNTGAIVTPAKPAVMGRVVYGPIHLRGTLQSAQDILLNLQRTWGDIVNNPSLIPEDKRQVAHAARNLLDIAEAQVDKTTGDIIKANPISFEDAWNFKKAIDPVFAKDHTAAELTSALNKDITDSIPSWNTVRRVAAAEGFENAKKISGERITTFFARDTKGNKAILNKLIAHGNNEISSVENIISNPVKLQKALTLNRMDLPGGAIITTNMRGILRGYNTGRLLNEAWEADARDTTKSVFNAGKILKSLNDPNMQESYKLLYSSEGLKNLRELVQGLATTQQSMMIAGPYIKYAWPTRAGITIAAGLVANNMTGPSALFGVGVVGLMLGGSAAGKLMTNPHSGRILAALAKGEKTASDAYIGRVIAGSLKGAHDAVGLQMKDGSTVWGEIDKDGKFVESKD